MFSYLFLPDKKSYQNAQQFMRLGFQISKASDSMQSKPPLNENSILLIFSGNALFRRQKIEIL